MATYNSITGQGFVGNENYGNPCVGRGAYTYLGSEIFTVRYAFKTDGYGATKISFRTSDATDSFVNETGADSIGNIRFSISTSSTAYRGKQSASAGYAISSYSHKSYISGSLTINLLPNTTYYLWFFPGSWGSGGRFNIGKCTLTTSGTYGQPNTISAPDGYFGQDIPITITRSSSTVTHTITSECLGINETIVSQSDEYPTVIWNPSIATYAPLLTDSTTTTATLTITTFNGSATIGSKSITINISFDPDSDEIAPTFTDSTWVVLSPYSEKSALSGYDVYVQNNSQVRAAFDASKIDFKYGTSLDSFSIIVNGVETSIEDSGSCLSATLSSDTTVTCKVKDKRGVIASEEISLVVLPYSNPILKDVSLFRCKETGDAFNEGTHLSAFATAVYSEIKDSSQNEINTVSLYVSVRRLSDSYPSSTGTQIDNSVVYVSEDEILDPNTSYEARIRCIDSFGNICDATARIPAQNWSLKFNVDKGVLQSVGIGKAPESASSLEIPDDWNVKRGDATALFSDSTSWVETRQTVGELETAMNNLSSSIFYKSGDSISGNFPGYGWVTTSGTDIVFLVPLELLKVNAQAYLLPDSNKSIRSVTSAIVTVVSLLTSAQVVQIEPPPSR